MGRQHKESNEVSIHARHCWRANLGGAEKQSQGENVSIHARHCWRANPAGQDGDNTKTLFQSTPAIAGGRIAVMMAARWCSGLCFNPRPPLLAGESQHLARRSSARNVSIHARHCWRANPRAMAGVEQSTEFQSTPAIAGGRIHTTEGHRLQLQVSIHARHCWRANLFWCRHFHHPTRVSIHARHCWRANRHCQSAGGHGPRGFNPRPPLLAGESLRM